MWYAKTLTLEFILWTPKQRLNCGRLTGPKYKWIILLYCVKPGFNQWKVDYLSQVCYQKWFMVLVWICVCVCVFACVKVTRHVKLVMADETQKQHRDVIHLTWAKHLVSLCSSTSFKGSFHSNDKSIFLTCLYWYRGVSVGFIYSGLEMSVS